jgi:hypothetical protein
MYYEDEPNDMIGGKIVPRNRGINGYLYHDAREVAQSR